LQAETAHFRTKMGLPHICLHLIAI
jgi:hypothetical protein